MVSGLVIAASMLLESVHKVSGLIMAVNISHGMFLYGMWINRGCQHIAWNVFIWLVV